MFDNTTNPILRAFDEDVAENFPFREADAVARWLEVLEGGPDEAALDHETAEFIREAVQPENYAEALRIRALENEAIRALREVVK